MSQLERALSALKNGQMVCLVDDEERENEGDLVLPAEFATPETINFLARHARGLICLSMERSQIERLEIPMMVDQNRSQRETAFTISVEAREGVTTGISAADRARTIRVASDPLAKPSDLVSPGHVFPLRAAAGGVLVRAGHTEGSIDLCRLAGLRPAAVICEIMNDDGTMARFPDLIRFAKEHGDIPVISIRDIISYRVEKDSLVEKIAEADFPTEFGGFRLHAFRNTIDGSEHVALVKGKITDPTLTRVHSECLTGDAMGSLRCDCGQQLRSAMAQISHNNSGVLVYMRRQEGRGIGLANKVRAYSLQDSGLDTVEANRHLGFKADLRQYGIGAQILRALGVRKLALLTNNPKKVVGLDAFGLSIERQIPIEMDPTPFSLPYLRTKRDKMGHQLSELEEKA